MGESVGAEEGKEMKPEPCLMPLYPLRASMPFSDDLVLTLEERGRLPERLLTDELTSSVLVAERQVPILSKLLRKCQTLLLRRRTPVLAGEVGGTLPEATVLTLVYVDFTAEDRVRRHGLPDTVHCVGFV